MLLKIEFPDSTSKAFPSILRACASFETFRKIKYRKALFYSVSGNEGAFKSLEAVLDMAKGIPGTLYYLDKTLVTERDFYQAIWDIRNKEVRKEKRDRRFMFMEALLPDLRKNNPDDEAGSN